MNFAHVAHDELVYEDRRGEDWCLARGWGADGEKEHSGLSGQCEDGRFGACRKTLSLCRNLIRQVHAAVNLVHCLRIPITTD